MRTETLAFYNVDNGRPPGQVADELEAILDLKPFVFGMVECVGNRIPHVPGFELLRDTSTRSRTNIGAYVRADADVSHVHWTDLRGTWPRPDNPGTHEPRSILSFRADELHAVIAHQPPKNARPVIPLQEEGIDALIRIVAPWHRDRDRWQKRPRRDQIRALERPRVVLADCNRRASEKGPGPTVLANRVDGHVASDRIDTAIGRAGKFSRVRYLEEIPREGHRPVPIRSDHGHMLLVDFTWDWPHAATR